jgi:hypothetical protein
MKEGRNMRNAVNNLSDDVLADIFSYLISDSYQRKKLSQTVIAFFYGR